MGYYEPTQEVQQQVSVSSDSPAPFWQTEWLWTGVFVPIVVAWIIHRRIKKRNGVGQDPQNGSK